MLKCRTLEIRQNVVDVTDRSYFVLLEYHDCNPIANGIMPSCKSISPLNACDIFGDAAAVILSSILRSCRILMQ